LVAPEPPLVLWRACDDGKRKEWNRGLFDKLGLYSTMQIYDQKSMRFRMAEWSCYPLRLVGLVVMTSVLHTENHEFDPRTEYFFLSFFRLSRVRSSETVPEEVFLFVF
jgi:hypothetical protein